MARKNNTKAATAYVVGGSVGAERMAFRAGRANAAGTMQDSRLHRLNTRGAQESDHASQWSLTPADMDDYDPSDPFDRYADYC